MHLNPTSPSNNCMQYLSVLDKCTQIVREDRIWLRHQIKNNNTQIISFFKGQTKTLNMKDLQIKIRKYLHKVKQHQKQQQLIRFKQNSNNLADLGHSALIRQNNKSQIVNKSSHPKGSSSVSVNNNALKEVQRNVSKSSIISKWNQYSHNNFNNTNNFSQKDLHEGYFPESMRSPTNASSMRDQRKQPTNSKQWTTNYRPHSFNKMLNGELNNKLNSTSNSKSTGKFKKPQQQYYQHNEFNINANSTIQERKPSEMSQEYYRNEGSLNGNNNIVDKLGRRGSAKSLRQLESRIYEELNKYEKRNNRFQGAKNDEISKKSAYSNKVVEAFNTQQEFTNKNQQLEAEHIPHTNKPSKSNQIHNNNYVSSTHKNIEEVLKQRLGNCNYQQQRNSRRRQQQVVNNEESEQDYESPNCQYESGKKLCDQGSFPPIQEQTERDSQCMTSQRNGIDDPFRAFGATNTYGNMNMNMNSSGEGEFNKSNLQFNLASSPKFAQMSAEKSSTSKQKSRGFYQQQQHQHQRQQYSAERNSPVVQTLKEVSNSQQKYQQKEYTANNRYEGDLEVRQSSTGKTTPIEQSASASSAGDSQFRFAQRSNRQRQEVQQYQQKASPKKRDTFQFRTSIVNSIEKSRQEFPSSLFSSASNRGKQQEKQKEQKTPQSQRFEFKPETFSINAGNQSQHSAGSYSRHSDWSDKQYSKVNDFNSDFSVKDYTNDGLFTSPQLLDECRNFLKKTQEIQLQNSGLSNLVASKSKHSNKFQSPSNHNSSSNKEYSHSLFNSGNNSNKLMMIQPITITNSITKDLPTSLDIEAGNSSAKQTYTEQKSEAIFSYNFQKNHQQNQVQEKQVFYQTGKQAFNNNNSQKKLEKQDEFLSIQYQQSNKNKGNGQQYASNQFICSSERGLNSKNENFSYNNFGKLSESQQALTGEQGFHTFSNKDFNKNNQCQNYKYSGQKQQEMKFQTHHQIQKSINDNKSVANVQPQQNHQQENQDCQNYQQQQQDLNNEPVNYSILDLPKYMEMQEIVDTLLQANQGNIEIDPTWLQHTLGNSSLFKPQIGDMLKYALSEFIQSENSINFIEISTKLQKIYQHSPASNSSLSQFKKCPARDIYLLLDIEEKGFIERDDMQNFITQLQQAEVENVQDVAQCIWKVYELSDFLGTGQIFYTSLYIIKNQEIFQELCQFLQEFQFEIEAQ